MQAKQNSTFNKGFSYIGLLLFIAITGTGLSVAGMSWQYQARAEKEKQLLFVGSEFRDAINSYYASSPNAAKVYPASLNDLLLDKRMPNIKRHLRKIYLDPMTGKADWSFVRQQGYIVGIYSKSTLAPYKQKGFNSADEKLVAAESYKEWIFSSNDSGKQTAIVNSSSLSNSVAARSLTTSESNLVKNSKISVEQEPTDKTATSSGQTNDEKQENNNEIRKLTMLEYLLKYGEWPDRSYYINK